MSTNGISTNLQKLIIVLGPTASGKSELALKLAKKFDGEIVSADSRQIFRGMDIGTAKLPRTQPLNLKFASADREEKAGLKKPTLIGGIPHYLIDAVNPDEEFSLALYKKTAAEIIDDITRRGKTPFLVGGTGLYITSLVDNLDIPRVAPNSALRKSLEDAPLDELAKKLEKLDPDTFQSIDKKNKRRLVRAMEVILATGRPFSRQKNKGVPLFDALQLGLSLPREELYKKIDSRVDNMISQGLETETRDLLDKGYARTLPSMSGIGYKQITMYLNDEINFNEAVRLIKRDSRRYARRQMTWFRRYKNIKWIAGCPEAEKLIKDFLKN